MIRLTLMRFMHDRKIPNITSSYILPPVLGSYDSPKKYDQSKLTPTNKEDRKGKSLWPKYRVHSQQYRGYKATYGDGRRLQPDVFDVEDMLWTSGPEHPKPYEHAEAEEEAIWGEVSHDYTHIDSVEAGDDDCLQDDKFKKLFNRK